MGGTYVNIKEEGVQCPYLMKTAREGDSKGEKLGVVKGDPPES